MMASASASGSVETGVATKAVAETGADRPAKPDTGCVSGAVCAPPRRALAILGPTASGKTALALELAQRCPIEIISIDSALVYREMDIGTAKPSAAEQAIAVHHLIDIRNPDTAYSAAEFASDARRLIVDITARGAVPVLVGGTLMYHKALTAGLDALPPADPAVRQRLEASAAALGWPALHAELAQVDPETAHRIAPRDAQRIQRALEVYTLTGQPMSRLQNRRAVTDVVLDVLSLEPADRAVLHARIAHRFADMLRAGLVDEVEQLKRRWPLHAGMPSMRCVGYRQVWDMLSGEMPRSDLQDRGVFATRQLAKRQLTWLRSLVDKTVVDTMTHGGLQHALHCAQAVCQRLLDTREP